MRYIIIYDISDDSIRDAIAKRLLDYGLIRVQHSSFIGDLPRFRLQSLIVDLNNILKGTRCNGTRNNGDNERKSIMIYPLCDSCYSKGLVIDDTIRYVCDKSYYGKGKKCERDHNYNMEGDDVTVI